MTGSMHRCGDCQIKLVVCRRDIAVVNGNIAVAVAFLKAAHMQSVNVVDMRIFHTAVGYHDRRAARALFSRLEKQLDIAFELALVRFEYFRNAQKNRGVAVVAAGVHIVVTGFVFRIDLLVYRQSVHIGADGEALAARIAYKSDNAVAVFTFGVGNAPLVQL